MAHLFAYDGVSGSAYARSFALHDNIPRSQVLFYYDPNDDCTNFISQCVWAAYGGWIPGYSDVIVAQNAQRIKQDVRQVSGAWYGSRDYIGSTVWCRVGEFYSFITAQKTLGPRATKIAEGKFAFVDPSIIRVGDVIQMIVASYTPDRYGHSLYVTKAGEYWDDILICCHSLDRLDAPMSIFARFPDNYLKMRVLRFDSAAFET